MMKYSELISLDTATGIIQAYIFSANSVFDPNVTATGRQPRGHDQLATMYSQYCVVGSKIKVKFLSENVGVDANFVGLSLNARAIPAGNVADYMESRYNRFATLSTNNEGNKTTLTSKFSAKRFFSTKPLTDTEQTTAVGFNPTKRAYYHIWVNPDTAAGDGSPVRMLVDVQYLTVWMFPIEPPPS